MVECLRSMWWEPVTSKGYRVEEGRLGGRAEHCDSEQLGTLRWVLRWLVREQREARVR